MYYFAGTKRDCTSAQRVFTWNTTVRGHMQM